MSTAGRSDPVLTGGSQRLEGASSAGSGRLNPHPTHDEDCAFCRANRGDFSTASPGFERLVYEDRLWSMQSVSPPYGVPGWCIVQTQRHVAGTADLDDEEAASMGPFFRHVERALRDASGAERIYTAIVSESNPHFRVNLVPRLPAMPADSIGWEAFLLHRRARRGEIEVDVEEHERIVRALATTLAESPPPSHSEVVRNQTNRLEG